MNDIFFFELKQLVSETSLHSCHSVNSDVLTDKTLFIYLFIYLFLIAPHGMQNFPDQGTNPRPLQWKLRVLTTEPPGKVLSMYILNSDF